MEYRFEKKEDAEKKVEELKNNITRRFCPLAKSVCISGVPLTLDGWPMGINKDKCECWEEAFFFEYTGEMSGKTVFVVNESSCQNAMFHEHDISGYIQY